MRMFACFLIVALAALPAFAEGPACRQDDDVAKRISKRIDKVLDAYGKRAARELADLVKKELAKVRRTSGAVDVATVSRWDKYLEQTAPKLLNRGVSGDFRKALSDRSMRRKIARLLASTTTESPRKAGGRMFEIDEDGGMRVRKSKEKEVRDLLANAGTVTEPAPTGKPYLGFSPDRDFTDNDRDELGLDPGEGMRVSTVATDGPADAAGLRKGDIVLQIGGKDFTEDGARAVVAGLRPGQRVKIKIFRDDEEKTLSLTVGKRGE